jgi:response regulator RpfG family c-di-GMP phosphodiesterase
MPLSRFGIILSLFFINVISSRKKECQVMRKNHKRNGMKKVLMIVEDFDFIRNLVGRQLQMDGYEVISAGNIHEAAEIGQREQPEVVITDFDMSNDPYVIVSILHNILPMSRIIMVNGRSRHCDTEEAKTAGADVILEREFNPAVLEEIVHGKCEPVHG